jgi:hypothetical protein
MAGHCLNGIHCQTHACICRCDGCSPRMMTRIAITLYVDVPEGMNDTEIENWVCGHFSASDRAMCSGKRGIGPLRDETPK